MGGRKDVEEGGGRQDDHHHNRYAAVTCKKSPPYVWYKISTTQHEKQTSKPNANNMMNYAKWIVLAVCFILHVIFFCICYHVRYRYGGFAATLGAGAGLALFLTWMKYSWWTMVIGWAIGINVILEKH